MWKLTPFSVSNNTTPQAKRRPKRNPRDPRHKSYRRPTSPLPLIVRGPPRDIPLEYSPKADAKKPIRKPGPELRTKQAKITQTAPNIPIKHTNFQAGPNLKTLMTQMEAIHAPTPPSKKPVIKGALIKGQKKPKGSINVPRPRPQIDTPRLAPMKPVDHPRTLERKISPGQPLSTKSFRFPDQNPTLITG